MEMAQPTALWDGGFARQIDQSACEWGRLRDDEWGRLTEAVDRLAKAQLFIDETPALNPVELRAR